MTQPSGTATVMGRCFKGAFVPPGGGEGGEVGGWAVRVSLRPLWPGIRQESQAGRLVVDSTERTGTAWLPPPVAPALHVSISSSQSKRSSALKGRQKG